MQKHKSLADQQLVPGSAHLATMLSTKTVWNLQIAAGSVALLKALSTQRFFLQNQ
jgi:hypothetical protein